eukprot:3250126-Lingulodinium_polyedra.AAC.1
MHVVEQRRCGNGIGELEFGRRGEATARVHRGAERLEPLQLAVAAEGYIMSVAAFVVGHGAE